MATTLRDDIKQTRPFKSLLEEASLNIARTAAILADTFDQTVKPYGITSTQYNVLRILRGAGEAGLCRNDVRDRLVTRMPDATRLLDRMEAAGLISRARDAEDRRMVTTRLTKQGKQLVDELDSVVSRHHRSTLGHLSEKQLSSLVSVLTLLRNPP